MNNKVVEDFFHSAVCFCSIIEKFDPNKVDNNFEVILVALLDLYSKALYLPEVELEKEKVTDIEIPVPEINFGQYDKYWEVFDPYEFEEPLVTSLSDDILDIYEDVKRGIVLYEQNQLLEGIWQWKINFEIHWGSHAVDAIRALHSACFSRC